MKLLLAHNYYLQRGGEDECFEEESAVLSEAGHLVIPYSKHSKDIVSSSKLKMASLAIWNRRSYDEVRQLIRRHNPEIVHVANTFPFISPSIYWAAEAEGVPTVASLQNYRGFCPSALIFRENRRCTDCRGRLFAWPGVRYGCYRSSRPATAVVATMQAVHRLFNTWSCIDQFYAVSHTTRNEYIKAGFPGERIMVKPNFLKNDPGTGRGEGGYALFAGRLTEEKGLRLLLQAWVETMPLGLKIVGDGPLKKEVELAGGQVEYCGMRPLPDVLKLMQNARMTLVPSLWPEPFGRVVAESYACGTPVLAAPFGALKTIVKPGQTGFHFKPNAEALRQTVKHFCDLEPSEQKQLRESAREEYQQLYTPSRNLDFIMSLYQSAIDHRRSRRR